MVQVLKGEVCSSKGQRKKGHTQVWTLLPLMNSLSVRELIYLLLMCELELYSSLKTLIVKLTCRLFQIIRENSFYDDPQDFHPGDHNVWTDGRMQAERHRLSLITNYSTKILFTVHRSLDPSNGPIWCFLVICNGPVQSFRYEDIFTVELSSWWNTNTTGWIIFTVQ